jgi:hypothetical protein
LVMLNYDLLVLVTMNLVDKKGCRRGLGGRGEGSNIGTFYDFSNAYKSNIQVKK